ncbi:MAG: peptidoglycan-associated lipoprotein Pal [Desulfobacterales bacterium]|nr:MAG: peptidoglycan-associated lipoprotein Pal [Desulfobacterales bacterium]
MQKKLGIVLALLLVIPGLMFTVSCQKKTVAIAKEPVMEEAPPEEPMEEEKEAVIEEEPVPDKMAELFVQEDIHFEFDKSTLTPTAQDILSRKGEWLRENPDVSFTIEGHCDERGTNEYNLALGDRRAESAKAFLVDLGIDASRITTISYGEERPVDPGHNEEAWAQNRRDHFVID